MHSVFIVSKVGGTSLIYDDCLVVYYLQEIAVTDEVDAEEEKPIHPGPPRAKSSFFRSTPWCAGYVIICYNNYYYTHIVRSR
jgi:hypothetical protein